MVRKIVDELSFPGSPVTPADWLSAIKPGGEYDPRHMDIVLASARATADNVQDTPFGPAFEFTVPDDSSYWQVTVVHPELGSISLGIGGEVFSPNITVSSPPDNSQTDRKTWTNKVRAHLRRVTSYLKLSDNTPPELKQALLSRESNYTSLLQEI